MAPCPPDSSFLACQDGFPRPVFLDLFLTEDCNCRCDYCFVGKPGKPTRLSHAAAMQTVDFLLDSWEGPEEPGILFFGGEPLLAFDLIREMVKYTGQCAANGKPAIHWSMTTNGTLMTEHMMAFFAEHKIQYLLSMDGGREGHNLHRKLKNGQGSFDLLAQRLPLMKSYQPWLGARVTPTPQTVGLLACNIQELCDMGINQFVVGMASGLPWSAEDAEIFLDQMMELYHLYLRRTAAGHYMRLTLFEKDDLEGGEKDLTHSWGCGAGRRRLCVNPRGELYGCARFAALDNGQGALKLGDVWRGPFRLSVRRDLCNDVVWRRPLCVECPARSRCGGGCPAVNYQDTGSIFDPSPFECLSTRVYVELKQRIAQLQESQDKTLPLHECLKKEEGS
jgi:uncharacterized protein